VETIGISKATFSVPVGMSPFARRILRQAAEIANIEVTSFVKESTAALVREWDSLRSCAYVVVFDWGGGTLDVSGFVAKFGVKPFRASEAIQVVNSVRQLRRTTQR
jgi:molecular chaperone DnaK (HSP70)